MALFRFFLIDKKKGEKRPSSVVVTIVAFFSLKIARAKNHRRHVQPSRVLRHGNRRATGRTHRNDGASSSKKNLFSFGKNKLLLLLRLFFSLLSISKKKREKNLDRHFLDRFFLYCCDDSFTLNARVLRDHLHE